MNTYKIADLLINLEPSGRTGVQAEPYKVEYSDSPDYTFDISQGAVEAFKKNHPEAKISDWEYVLMQIKLCSCLLENDGMVLHSSSVALDGNAYLFSADSGTGKSTHTNLWKRCFKDAYIINDDKPALRYINGKFYVYGTPWSGSSALNKNVKLPLKAICFIERGNENSISLMTDKLEILECLMTQTLRKTAAPKMDTLLYLLDKLITEVPVYKLKCLPNEEAALLSHSVMSK